MARRIKLQFHDKEYIIEYSNRAEVLSYFAELDIVSKNVAGKDKEVDVENFDVENGFNALILLIKAGLVEHHKDDMPSDSELARWVLIIPNPNEFYETLRGMVQDVISTINDDRKNMKWEVEEA